MNRTDLPVAEEFGRAWTQAGGREGGSGGGGSGDGDGGQPRAGRPRRRRWPWVLLGTAFALVALVVALGAWVVGTASGTAWAVGQADARVPGLRIGGAQGTLADGLVLHAVGWAPPAGGTAATLRRLRIALDARALLGGVVQVRDLEVRDVRVVLAPSPPDEEDAPFSLDPPIDVIVDRIAARDVVVERDGVPLARVHAADARGRWTGDGLVVEALDVRAAEGAVRLVGRVAGGPVYAATADGEFRWRVGAATWAGTLAVATEGERVSATVALARPTAARATATLVQSAPHPWTLALDVPRFDPRGSLLAADAALASVAADLRAEGAATRASIRGRVLANDQPLEIETLRLARSADGAVVLDRLAVRPFGSPGRFVARGRVETAATPVRGRVAAEWADVVVPAALAGQALRTRGRLEGVGSAIDWRAEGRVDVGAAGRNVRIELDAAGTPERVELARLDVVQASGSLGARGAVTLRPRVGWDLEAEATSFDPGELLAGWSGDLGFALASAGTLESAGPAGRLQLRDLEGRLRGRPVTGRADLEFALPARLAGEARLASGASRVALDASGGERLDARATFAVPSLDDFVPGAAGAIAGRVRARGTWPDLAVDGEVGGTGLRSGVATVGTIDATFDVRRPLAPEGRVRVVAAKLAAGALAFDRLTLDATGSPEAHRVELAADGERLDVRVAAAGALAVAAGRPARPLAWRGAVERLELAGRELPAFALEAPARLAYGDAGLSLGRSCLAGADARLCAAADVRPDGALAAEYAIERVPLALAGLAVALPGELRGTLDGAGRVRRDSAGRWYGDVRVSSPEAAFVLAPDLPAGGEPLRLYRDLELVARLDGTRADARLGAAVGGDGRLDAEATVADLDAAAPAIRGRLDAALPSLAPYAPFLPQVEALDGRVDVRASVAGTLAEPRVDARATASALVAELPLLGLRLRDGEFGATVRPDGRVAVTGRVRSGDGTLALRADGRLDGTGQGTLAGQNLLAADLPAARVIAAPDLQVTRDADGVRVTGRVAIPAATVNLQRLPQAGGQKRSPDVVVVDEPPPERADSAPVPLYARVEIVLGDDVELAGFGLQATVGGQLVVTERPGRRTVGSGEIRIAGQYKAYGQDLRITEGRVLYAGTPLDDPRLDIVAVRDLDDGLQAGLRIRGTGRDPEVTVFSDPSLGETDALAYLVTGRPMRSIGGGTGEQGELVQQAAQSLGTAAGGLLAKRFGQRLGVDEVGVGENEDLGGTAFTVGQYLSPRLYLGYGVGLFDPGQVVTLRYALSEAVSVEAVRADERMRAGVEYRVER